MLHAFGIPYGALVHYWGCNTHIPLLLEKFSKVINKLLHWETMRWSLMALDLGDDAPEKPPCIRHP